MTGYYHIENEIFRDRLSKLMPEGMTVDQFLDVVRVSTPIKNGYVSHDIIFGELAKLKEKPEMVTPINTYSEPKVPSYWKSKNHYDPDICNSSFFTNTILTVEEKIDGSQFSFGYLKNSFGTHVTVFRSKNQEIKYYDKTNMFSKALQHIHSMCPSTHLPKDVVFRCEFVQSLKHNKLTYNRVPNGYLVMFGAENVVTGEQLPRETWSMVAKQMGVDVVRTFGNIDTNGKSVSEIINKASECLGVESMLGGQIEGVVLKRMGAQVMDANGDVIYAKIVRPEFREIMHPDIKKGPLTQEEVIQNLVNMVERDAVFTKAVQHLLEEGRIVGTTRDIGAIIGEVKKDIIKDFETTAKQVLWDWAKDQVVYGCVKGVAKWYQERLARAAASENVDVVDAEVVGDSADQSGQVDGTARTGEDLSPDR